MDVYDIIIIFVLATYAVVFAIYIYYTRKAMKQKTKLDLTTQQKASIVKDALRLLNCEGKWKTEKESRNVTYEYQNGNFRIRIEDQKMFVELGYFFCFSTEMENLQTVRHLCNLCNLSAETCRFYYTVDAEKNKIYAHITASLLPQEHAMASILTKTMSEMFYWQSAFSRGFDNQMEASKKADTRDMEADNSKWKRMMFLLREQEMLSQHVTPKERLGVAVPLTVGEAVNTIFAFAEIKPKRLVISTDKIVEITDENAISDYNIADAIVSDGEFCYEEAMLSLEFIDLRRTNYIRHIVLHLNEEKAAEHTLYFRLTATLLPLSISRDVQTLSPDNHPQCISMIVAYDLTSTEQLLNEFLYMKKETEALLKEGKDDQLTEEQQLIVDCTDDQVGYHLYHGKRLFLAKRFLEAEPHLCNAFDLMIPLFPSMKSRAQEAFYDTCYMLGFCYNEMRQFQRSYYYLELLFPLRRITYTEEYINCLVNQNDFRALQVIESVQETVEEVMNNSDGDEDADDVEKPETDITLASFCGFLKRRKAYLLIGRGRYDDARSILNELLNDPDSTDFAMNELAYLQKISEQ